MKSPQPTADKRKARPRHSDRTAAHDLTAMHSDFAAPGADGAIQTTRGPLQRKTEIGASNDPLEKEADAVADKVMRSPAENAAPCGTAEQDTIRMKASPGTATGGPKASPALERGLSSSKGGGKKLPDGVQQEMGQKMGADFSDVRVHIDNDADRMAQQVSAKAFTSGKDIYFKQGQYAPSSEKGKHLLAHELTHTIQQDAMAGNAAPQIQRALDVDDVTNEVIGQKFTVDQDFTAMHAGTTHSFSSGQVVTIEAWPVSGPTTTVSVVESGVGKITTTLQKAWLTPYSQSVVGVRKYSVGLSGQKSAVATAGSKVDQKQAEVDALNAEKGKYKSNPDYWANSLKNLEDELARRQSVLEQKERVLSRMLVRESMYNRFDPLISKWVSYYNAQYKPVTELDPNIVKSMFYQESRLGTSGVHLAKGPYDWSSPINHPIKTTKNLGQAIDSSGAQQYLMIKEMAPTIYTRYKLDMLEDRAVWKGMSEGDWYRWNGGAGSFVDAMKEFFATRDVGSNNLMGNGDVDLNEDYEFWIRTAIKWLFVKYNSMNSPSWAAAVRAYNGGGSDATKYRNEVMGRVGGSGTLNVGNK